MIGRVHCGVGPSSAHAVSTADRRSLGPACRAVTAVNAGSRTSSKPLSQHAACMALAQPHTLKGCRGVMQVCDLFVARVVVRLPCATCCGPARAPGLLGVLTPSSDHRVPATLANNEEGNQTRSIFTSSAVDSRTQECCCTAFIGVLLYVKLCA